MAAEHGRMWKRSRPTKQERVCTTFLHNCTSDGRFYALIGIMVGPDFIRRADLYVHDDNRGEWQYVRKVADAYQQNTAPVMMSNGEYILPGRMADAVDNKSLFSAVAISDSIEGDWEVIQLPTANSASRTRNDRLCDGDNSLPLVRVRSWSCAVFEAMILANMVRDHSPNRSPRVKIVCRVEVPGRDIFL